MASGKTLQMRAIRKPIPVPLHRHAGAPRWIRRNRRAAKEWKGSWVLNEPYVKPGGAE